MASLSRSSLSFCNSSWSWCFCFSSCSNKSSVWYFLAVLAEETTWGFFLEWWWEGGGGLSEKGGKKKKKRGGRKKKKERKEKKRKKERKEKKKRRKKKEEKYLSLHSRIPINSLNNVVILIENGIHFTTTSTFNTISFFEIFVVFSFDLEEEGGGLEKNMKKEREGREIMIINDKNVDK